MIRQLILILPFAFFIQSANVKAAEFKSAQEMMAMDDMSDPFNLSAVFQRCSGLFMAVAKFIPNDMVEQREKLITASALHLSFATKLMAKKRNLPVDSQTVSDQIEKALPVYIDIYYDHMEVAQIKTGSMFDEFFETEQSLCTQLLNMAQG
jgi:hypothetical protein